MKTINVSPGQVGWLVDCDVTGGPIAFLSGGRAETAAWRLAAAVASAYGQTQVVVRDRLGVVVGSAIVD